MTKGRRTDGMRRATATGTATKTRVQPSTSDQGTTPHTYEVMQVDTDQELDLVRMTAREIFEQTCPGEFPDAFEGMDEGEVRTKIKKQASRQTVIEDKWHPLDVPTVVDACVAYITECRELKKLDTTQMNRVRAPATPPFRGGR